MKFDMNYKLQLEALSLNAKCSKSVILKQIWQLDV